MDLMHHYYLLAISTLVVLPISSPYVLPPNPPKRTILSVESEIHDNMNNSSANNPPLSFASIEQMYAASKLSSPAQCRDNDAPTIAIARDEVFRLGSVVGKMCSSFLTVPRDSEEGKAFWGALSSQKNEVANHMGRVFLALLSVATVCGIDLRTSILKKIELNGRKYPVELCKGQSTIDTPTNSSFGDSEESNDDCIVNCKTSVEDNNTIEGISLIIGEFANERLWNRYHTPRNIALALLGEVGELAELFQWKGDVGTGDNLSETEGNLCLVGWTEEEVDKVSQEIADVSIYLIRLADVCNIRLDETAKLLLENESDNSSYKVRKDRVEVTAKGRHYYCSMLHATSLQSAQSALSLPRRIEHPAQRNLRVLGYDSLLNLLLLFSDRVNVLQFFV
ncbi:hypothetical protein ACHAXS_012311 [Conticribra weissflogii]